jgi:hypothetical protein
MPVLSAYIKGVLIIALGVWDVDVVRFYLS